MIGSRTVPAFLHVLFPRRRSMKTELFRKIAFFQRFGPLESVEQIGDVLTRLFGAERDGDRCDQTGDEPGDDLVEFCVKDDALHIVVFEVEEDHPQNIDGEARDDTGYGALVVEPSPVEREQDDRTERRAERAPRSGNEAHNGAERGNDRAIARSEYRYAQRKNGDGDDDDAANPHDVFVGSFFIDGRLIHVGGERQGRGE